jgi:hypothetical protein
VKNKLLESTLLLNEGLVEKYKKWGIKQAQEGAEKKLSPRKISEEMKENITDALADLKKTKDKEEIEHIEGYINTCYEYSVKGLYWLTYEFYNSFLPSHIEKQLSGEKKRLVISEYQKVYDKYKAEYIIWINKIKPIGNKYDHSKVKERMNKVLGSPLEMKSHRMAYDATIKKYF